MLRVRREYQSWVAKESLEDYALRYAASSYRRWSPRVVAHTAIGGISVLALEAIGASITLSCPRRNPPSTSLDSSARRVIVGSEGRGRSSRTRFTSKSQSRRK